MDEQDDAPPGNVATTVTVQGKTWTPTPPSDIAITYDLVALGATNATRAFAGALVVTWRGPNRPKINYRECAYDAGLFGGRCLAELLKRGLTFDEILAAGGIAWTALVAAIPKPEEVKAAEGFSEAGPPASSSAG